jgi:hypothetical protein
LGTLLEDVKTCKNRIGLQGLFAAGPLYFTYGFSCNMPSAMVVEAVPKINGTYLHKSSFFLNMILIVNDS